MSVALKAVVRDQMLADPMVLWLAVMRADCSVLQLADLMAVLMERHLVEQTDMMLVGC